MKRKCKAIFLAQAMALVMFLSACSGSEISQSEYDAVVSERDALQAEIELLRSLLNSDDEASGETEQENLTHTKKIAGIGERVASDTWAITLVDYVLATEIENQYSTFESRIPHENKVYGIPILEIENLTDDELIIDPLKIVQYVDDITYNSEPFYADAPTVCKGYELLGAYGDVPSVAPHRKRVGWITSQIPVDTTYVEIEYQGLVVCANVDPDEAAPMRR